MDKMAFPLTISGLMDIDDNFQNFKWEELTDGIQIHRIYEEENNGSSAALLKYSAGLIIKFFASEEKVNLILDVAIMFKYIKSKRMNGNYIIRCLNHAVN